MVIRQATNDRCWIRTALSQVAKGKLLYTHDPTISDLCDRLSQIGDRDTGLQLFAAATGVLPAMYKARKWFVTRGDLEALKHKGDRQYYEFTLLKGAKPQAFSTVALQLKKTDPKRGKYTLNVTADDRTIEKKDRNQSEPVQFYTGREHMLYELVAWTVDKNKVTGYLSTPKNAPVAITATPQ